MVHTVSVKGESCVWTTKSTKGDVYYLPSTRFIPLSPMSVQNKDNLQDEEHNNERDEV